MRFKSASVDGFQAFAVSGTNTISFAFQASVPAKRGLLGFAVERKDKAESESYRMPGFKVFRSIIPHPDEKTQVSTFEHPIQSFVWDDFTAKPDREYEYSFHPLRGTPKALDRTAKPIRIKVRTEQLFSKDEHDVFFNRGVASSQAYRRKFGNKTPKELGEEESKEREQEALDWLTRELDDAILKFIATAAKGDTLLCCFYEFRYKQVADALKKALNGGVDVRIIVDAKRNKPRDKKGKILPPFPRTENLEMINAVGLKKRTVFRDAIPSAIQHNKFMVLLKGRKQKPSAVWTGSTNISLGGISGQTNVGHWVRNESVAERFKGYWDLLATNPGGTKGAAGATKANAAYRKAAEALQEAPTTIAAIPKGVTPLFSPRPGVTLLNLYATLVDSSKVVSGVTLAFGVNKVFKAMLTDNTGNSGVVFMLLEKKDKPRKNSKDAFVAINASNNVYKAWGAFIKDPVYQWAKETNTRQLQLNSHVAYVHSKFLMMDPLGSDPIVVTGSANFSDASTSKNDENMLIIRGSRRVGDIYFTEFNRLFNHYYFRAVYEEAKDRDSKATDANLFLDETGKEWLKKYAPGKLRTKRVAIYAKMTDFTRL